MLPYFYSTHEKGITTAFFHHLAFKSSTVLLQFGEENIVLLTLLLVKVKDENKWILAALSLKLVNIVCRNLHHKLHPSSQISKLNFTFWWSGLQLVEITIDTDMFPNFC